MEFLMRIYGSITGIIWLDLCGSYSHGADYWRFPIPSRQLVFWWTSPAILAQYMWITWIVPELSSRFLTSWWDSFGSAKVYQPNFTIALGPLLGGPTSKSVVNGRIWQNWDSFTRGKQLPGYFQSLPGRGTGTPAHHDLLSVVLTTWMPALLLGGFQKHLHILTGIKLGQAKCCSVTDSQKASS